jgi:hypothetical protein
MVIKLDIQLRNKRTLNKVKATKVIELENQVSYIIDSKKATSYFKCPMEEKDREINNLNAKLKIP